LVFPIWLLTLFDAARSVIVSMIAIVIMLMRLGVRGHEDDVTMAHATFRDDAIRERSHLRAFALQRRQFEATVVVEMDMERRLRDAVMVMKFVHSRLGSSRAAWP
jgi:hypothetical protein